MKIKIDTLKLKKLLKALPDVLVNNFVLLLFFVILFDALLGAFVFYQYSFLSQRKVVEVPQAPPILKESLLSEVLKELEERENRFEETELKTYPDLFRTEQLVEPEESIESEELTE